MPELDDRFRDLDGVPAPDQWTDISTREPGRMEPRRPRTSTVAILAAFAVLVGSIAWLAVAIAGRSDQPPRPLGSSGSASPAPPSASALPASVTGVSTDGSLRCTASVESDVVEPGGTTTVRFAAENVSTEQLQIGDETQVLVDDASGQQVYDSLLMRPGFGAGRAAEQLVPGARLGLPLARVPIRWPGPLTLHPVCPVPQGDTAGSLRLPPLELRVTNPGPAPGPAEAVSAALDAFAPLFANCRPEPDAGPVAGAVGPLPGSGMDALALDARCEATVDPEPGFDVVTVTFVSPPDAEVPEIPDPLFAGRPPFPSTAGSVEVWRAMVVVTATGSFVVEQPQFVYTATEVTIAASFEDGRWATTGEVSCSTGRVTGSGGGVVFFRAGSCPSTVGSPPASSGAAG